MLTRRQLLVSAAGAASVVLLDRDRADAALSWPRHPGQIIKDDTVRSHGPIMFIGDSTTAKSCDAMGKALTRRDVGPYRVDLNLARLISIDHPLRPSAITAVQRARTEGFDQDGTGEAAYLIGLGFPDVLAGDLCKVFYKDPINVTAQIVEPLLAAIGPNRTVAFLNLYGTKSSKSSRAKQFNAGLAALQPSWPRLHIIDWASTAKRHRWWHKLDGFHYTYRGGLERQRFVVDAMATTADLRGADLAALQ